MSTLEETKGVLGVIRFLLLLGTISGSKPCATGFAGLSIAISIDGLSLG